MKRAASITALVLFVMASCLTAGAQTRRHRAKPAATPVPSLSGAEIISQAGDLQDPNAPLAADPRPESTPKPPSATTTRLNNIDARLQKIESGNSQVDPDAKQKRMLLNLDILSRAEQRADSLRKQVFDLIEKENSIQKQLEEIAYEIRPEVIERQLQLGGSLRPEEVRENRRKQLAAEQTNLENMLTHVQTTRASLEASLAKADEMVAKLREKLEKDIDNTFLKDDQPTDRPDEQ